VEYFGAGLHAPDHVGQPCKIRFFAHPILAAWEHRGRAGAGKLELILPDGRIDPEADRIIDMDDIGHATTRHSQQMGRHHRDPCACRQVELDTAESTCAMRTMSRG